MFKENMEGDFSKEDQAGRIHDKENEYDKPEEREGYLLDLVDHYMKFLDLWEEVRERLLAQGQEDLVEEILEINFANTKKFIDEKMVILAEDINDEIREKKIVVVANNSFADAVNNSTTAWIYGGEKIIYSIDRGEIKSADELKPIWKQYASGLRNAFVIMPLYLDEICKDKRKLEMELTDHNGYLKKFKKYIIDMTTMSGSHKLPYFLFFSKLEKGQINSATIEQEIMALDEKLINKELIRADIDSFFKKEER